MVAFVGVGPLESSGFALHQNGKLVLAKRCGAGGKGPPGRCWLGLSSQSLVSVGQEQCECSPLLRSVPYKQSSSLHSRKTFPRCFQVGEHPPGKLQFHLCFVHGAGGFGVDFSLATDDFKSGLDLVSQKILSHGVTSFCPTLVTSPPSVYHQVSDFLPPHLQGGQELRLVREVGGLRLALQSCLGGKAVGRRS